MTLYLAPAKMGLRSYQTQPGTMHQPELLKRNAETPLLAPPAIEPMYGDQMAKEVTHWFIDPT